MPMLRNLVRSRAIRSSCFSLNLEFMIIGFVKQTSLVFQVLNSTAGINNLPARSVLFAEFPACWRGDQRAFLAGSGFDCDTSIAPCRWSPMRWADTLGM